MPADDVMRSADVMASVLKDPAKLEEIRVNPSKVDGIASSAKEQTDAVHQIVRRASALEADRFVYRMTTAFLGGTVIVIAVGIVVIRLAPLWWPGKVGPENIRAFDIPESLVAIASTAVGALAGLLSPLGSRSS